MCVDGSACRMQVYLVGDPAQLPATVMSERAVAHGYTRSMFQRLQAIGHPVQASPSCPSISLCSHLWAQYPISLCTAWLTTWRGKLHIPFYTAHD